MPVAIAFYVSEQRLSSFRVGRPAVWIGVEKGL